jgi:hypothetical protein
MDVHGLIRKHPWANAPPEREGRDDAKNCHEHRGQTNLQHVRHGRLKTDFEEKDDHSEARENFDRSIRLDGAKPTNSSEVQTPERDAGNEFAKHGRLSHSNGQVPAELRRGQNDRQRQHDRRDGISVPYSGVVSLCRRERRENYEERDDETTRERFAEGVLQVEPLVFDHEDGGPTTRRPATNTAAPFDVRFVSTSIGEGPTPKGAQEVAAV